MFQKLMDFVKRREKEVNFFYSQLDQWFLLEPNLSLNDRASVLCDVISCLQGEDIVKMDSMHQFIVCDSWKDVVPSRSNEYSEYIKSFDELIGKLEGKLDSECNDVIQDHKQKYVALLRLLDYHSIRRIIDECIADGLSEQHFALIK